jgi:hypothetical protein
MRAMSRRRITNRCAAFRIILGDVVAACPQVPPRRGSDDEARHPSRLALPPFVQQLREKLLAFQTFAAIQLVEANRDVATKRRELLLLLLVEADEGAPEGARVAEPAVARAPSALQGARCSASW